MLVISGSWTFLSTGVTFSTWTNISYLPTTCLFTSLKQPTMDNKTNNLNAQSHQSSQSATPTRHQTHFQKTPTSTIASKVADNDDSSVLHQRTSRISTPRKPRKMIQQSSDLQQSVATLIQTQPPHKRQKSHIT